MSVVAPDQTRPLAPWVGGWAHQGSADNARNTTRDSKTARGVYPWEVDGRYLID